MSIIFILYFYIVRFLRTIFGGSISTIFKFCFSMSMATTSPQEIDNLDIKLTGTDVAKLGGIALLISFVSTILASIGIIRMKPKDILSSN